MAFSDLKKYSNFNFLKIIVKIQDEVHNSSVVMFPQQFEVSLRLQNQTQDPVQALQTARLKTILVHA